MLSGTCSTSGRRRSSATSTWLGRSTRRPRPTGTSGAKSSPGRGRNAPMTSADSSAEILSGPIDVCVDRPLLSLDRPFTYDLPAEVGAGVGSLVQVSFHGRATRGWVLGSSEVPPTRILVVKKAVSRVRFFDDRQLALFRWVRDRYVAPLATVIGRAMPPRVASEESESGLPERVSSDAHPAAAAMSVLAGYRGGERSIEVLHEAGGAFVA